ncbi:MAG: hypothetical protein ACTIA6_01420 [Pseudoclavibacter sp.]
MSNKDLPGNDEGSVGAAAASADGTTDDAVDSGAGSVGAGGASADGTDARDE